MHGRLSIKLVNPIVLQNILRNVTLGLPESYGLIVSTDIENIHLYYDFNALSILANTHCINLLLHILWKSSHFHFILFKVITFPTLLSSDTFAHYILDFAYYGLQVSQCAYLMLTEAEYSNCKKKGSITICPAVTPVYRAQTVTCLSSLFFQSANTNRVCQRQLLLQQRTPNLQHHGNIWIFHFRTWHQISLRCPDTRDQINHTITFHGT